MKAERSHRPASLVDLQLKARSWSGSSMRLPTRRRHAPLSRGIAAGGLRPTLAVLWVTQRTAANVATFEGKRSRHQKNRHQATVPMTNLLTKNHDIGVRLRITWCPSEVVSRLSRRRYTGGWTGDRTRP